MFLKVMSLNLILRCLCQTGRQDFFFILGKRQGRYKMALKSFTLLSMLQLSLGHVPKATKREIEF